MEFYNELKKEPQLWKLFTRQEEYEPIKLDKYGRFLYKYSSDKNISYPFVSDFLIKKRLFYAEYPENKKFAVVLTHDIDDIYISNRHIIRSFLPFPINRNLSGFAPVIIEKLKGKKSAYLNFRKILQIEKKYDAVSSFFFLAREKDIFGEKYNLEDIREELLFILDNQCEVGLHTSYHAFKKSNEIIREKEKLEKIIGKRVKGVRTHLLLLTVPETWEILSKIGFAYDSSLGYHDMIGFRNGMCHPFLPFNTRTHSQIDIIEMPLAVIDIALFSYMGKNASESWTYIKNMIDTVEQLNGAFTLLWHNWTFSFPVSFAGLFGVEWTTLYEKIVAYCSKKNAWLTTGQELCEYYIQAGLLNF